jgi:hypothetical protein
MTAIVRNAVWLDLADRRHWPATVDPKQTVTNGR